MPDDFEASEAAIKIELKQLAQTVRTRAAQRDSLRGILEPKQLAEYDAGTQELREVIAALEAALKQPVSQDR